MIADTYHEVPRNREFDSRKPAKQVRASDAIIGWFAHYASFLAGIWGKDTAPLV
ncbi:hypothetical protein [Amaricoccus solimangrovi]|uniref:hypothetical protein n=1 Tax=Amaricoccus solimangrovi TaxID=2589815 RepID=UPI0015E30B77|nr:hypothetical protein [Amaricoccus solimangrovi]